jgi:hypothetical protein
MKEAQYFYLSPSVMVYEIPGNGGPMLRLRNGGKIKDAERAARMSGFRIHEWLNEKVARLN